MNINPINKAGLLQQYQVKKAYGVDEPNAPRMGTDKADLSEDALSFAKVYTKAREMVAEDDSQANAGRLEQLKAQIENGEYNVSSEDVAARMLFQMKL